MKLKLLSRAIKVLDNSHILRYNFNMNEKLYIAVSDMHTDLDDAYSAVDIAADLADNDPQDPEAATAFIIAFDRWRRLLDVVRHTNRIANAAITDAINDPAQETCIN